MQTHKKKRQVPASCLSATLFVLAATFVLSPGLVAEESDTVLPESGFVDEAVSDELFDDEADEDAEAPNIVGPIDPIQVHSEHILRAQLTPALESKGPTDRLGSSIQMNERGLIRVYLFTELEGLNNRRVYYDWYHEDERKARVTVRPHLDQMRASTSKFIDRHMTGPWRVVVRLSDDDVLASAAFDVLPFNDD